MRRRSRQAADGDAADAEADGDAAGSDGPARHAVAHVPEHPLVAAGGAEVASYPVAFGGRQAGSELVGVGEDLPDRRAELLAAVGVDPALVPRVGRAPAAKLLADLPVDPVARQHRADALGV